MLAETNSTGGAVNTYAYLPGDYAPYSMTTAAGVTYFYLKNARGDVTALTDTTGTVVAKYRYDPWGGILAITDGGGADVSGNPSHIANVNPWRYAGYYFDKESGIYYLQARYYRADLMRFISVDPICACKSNWLRSYEMYGYAGGNPISHVDSSGLKKKKIIRYTVWKYRSSGWYLKVVPTFRGRLQLPGEDQLGWKNVLARKTTKKRAMKHPLSMKNQFLCHYWFAFWKGSWNLDQDTKNRGYWGFVKKKCN